jgi:xylose isomerase
MEGGSRPDPYRPVPADHFTFGLWTVGNRGRDPFGREVRPPLDPVTAVRRLAPLGAYGVNFHDSDLVPEGSSAAERDAIVARFGAALDETGLKVPMATVNLFSHPVFRDGAFTANDPEVRRHALARTMDAVDLGVELGAGIFVLWGGREGVECDAAKPAAAALDRLAEAVDLLCDYVLTQGYDLCFALEPKPNEPRGDLLLPTVGHALAFIAGLTHPELVGVNPEFAHETMSGLSFHHGVAQALRAGKLFHIDLNGQRPGKFDQDFRFASEGQRDAFYTVKLLEDAAWPGMRHFDAHPYRTEDEDGVWDFATGCMRSYLILAEKARRFAADPDIAEALAAAGVAGLEEPTVPPGAGPDDLRPARVPPAGAAERGRAHERLDQLVNELLLGVR